MSALPRSLDDVHGLRAARWIRESTAGQFDRYGPASQREQQDRFIERHGRSKPRSKGLEQSARPGIPAARAVERLRALSETWQASDVHQQKAELLHTIYDRIVVAGERIVSARLTPEAQAHGMALALPQVVMARPTGVERADTRSICIPIEGQTRG